MRSESSCRRCFVELKCRCPHGPSRSSAVCRPSLVSRLSRNRSASLPPIKRDARGAHIQEQTTRRTGSRLYLSNLRKVAIDVTRRRSLPRPTRRGTPHNTRQPSRRLRTVLLPLCLRPHGRRALLSPIPLRPAPAAAARYVCAGEGCGSGLGCNEVQRCVQRSPRSVSPREPQRRILHFFASIFVAKNAKLVTGTCID